MPEYVFDLDRFEECDLDTGLREAVVRCRDCEHFCPACPEHGTSDWCAFHEHIAWSVNGFCSWGKPKGAR